MTGARSQEPGVRIKDKIPGLPGSFFLTTGIPAQHQQRKPVTEDQEANSHEQGKLNMTIVNEYLIKKVSLSHSSFWLLTSDSWLLSSGSCLLAPGSFLTDAPPGEKLP